MFTLQKESIHELLSQENGDLRRTERCQETDSVSSVDVFGLMIEQLGNSAINKTSLLLYVLQ